MTAASSTEPRDKEGNGQDKPAPTHSEDDIDALAERVYRLMMREIRLERARGTAIGRR